MATSSLDAGRPGCSSPAPPAAQAWETARTRRGRAMKAGLKGMGTNVPDCIGLFKRHDIALCLSGVAVPLDPTGRFAYEPRSFPGNAPEILANRENCPCPAAAN